MNKANRASANAWVPRIENRIQLIRGVRVMIDTDLAALYGVPTKALNQAVKRNAARFPADFMFQLTPAEKLEVVTNCDHLVSLKFSRSLPYAFTEHGAIQSANLLASSQAVEMGIYVVRAFVQLREVLSAQADVHQRLAALEQRTERLAQAHDTFSHTTRDQLRQLLDALRALTMPPHAPKRPIGFVPLEEKPRSDPGARVGKRGPAAG